tara:strand:+ start:954 stop:1841 length:888 start_codon:yes stop_codon:yes gene_type:complete
MEIRRRPPNPSVKVANLEYGIPHSESEPRNILEKIVWEKDREVELARNTVTLETLKSQIADLSHPLNFIDALKAATVMPAVIAEIKKASPSKGIIRENFNHIEIAKSYQKGGASCLSVLTDKTFFQGGFDILLDVRKTVQLPLLCKDFILTPYQVYQARAAGADAILLIAAILSDQDLMYLNKVAKSLGLSVLLEVHDEKELDRVIKLRGFSLVGINNRNLRDFNIDLKITEQLAKTFKNEIIDQDILLVSESGLFSRSDLDKVERAGAKAVLVGEALMKQEDITAGLIELIGSY